MKEEKKVNLKEYSLMDILQDFRFTPKLGFKGEFDLWIYTKEKFEEPEETMCKELKEDIIHFGEAGGIAWFYCNSKTNCWDMGPNYRWSSRAGVINPLLPEDEHIIEVAINNCSGAITLKALKEFLPKEYKINREDDKYGEIRYYITLNK